MLFRRRFSKYERVLIKCSGVLLAMGISSWIWVPLGDWLTRRISYNIAIAVMFVTSIGTAVSHNFATFTAMRLLTGFTGTYFMVAGQTLIADTFGPLVRGRAVGCMMVGSVSVSHIIAPAPSRCGKY